MLPISKILKKLISRFKKDDGPKSLKGKQWVQYKQNLAKRMEKETNRRLGKGVKLAIKIQSDEKELNQLNFKMIIAPNTSESKWEKDSACQATSSNGVEIVYVDGPRAGTETSDTEECGYAVDRVKFKLSDPTVEGLIIQHVAYDINSIKRGEAPYRDSTKYYEAWEVKNGKVMSPRTGHHDQFQIGDSPDEPYTLGQGSKSNPECKISGQVKFVPCARLSLFWVKKGDPRAGNLHVYRGPGTPKEWGSEKASSAKKRKLVSRWNCYSGETRVDTDVSGSGPG